MFLGVSSFFLSPPPKSIFWNWKSLQVLNSSWKPETFFHCPGAPAVLLQFKVTFQHLRITFFFLLLVLFGLVFFLTSSFLYFLLQEKDWQALPGCHHVLAEWLVRGVRVIMQFVLIMPLQKAGNLREGWSCGQFIRCSSQRKVCQTRESDMLLHTWKWCSVPC